MRQSRYSVGSYRGDKTMALTIAVVDDDPLYLRAIRSVLDGLYPSTKVQEFQSTKAIEPHPVSGKMPPHAKPAR